MQQENKSFKLGLQLMVLLYDGKTDDNLNKMQYAAYCNLSSTSKNVPQPEKLPPTERAASYHILRAHHQAVVWKHFAIGCARSFTLGLVTIEDNKLVPVKADLPAAPLDVLNVI
jgi:hypothetical protein